MPALAAHLPIPPKLLVSLVVLGIALIVWAIVAIAKSGSKKPPMQIAPNAPPCNTCGGPARWNYNGWVCDRCQRQVIPMMGAPGMPPQQMMPPQYGQPNMAPLGMPPQQYGQQPGMPQPMAGGPQMGAAPQGPTCQTCHGPGRWIPESNAWGCDRCRQLIGPAAQA